MVIDKGIAEGVSGLTAGMITTLVAHPMDFVKLRLQLDKTSKTQWQSFQYIYKHLISLSKSKSGQIQYIQLVKNLYRGLGPNLVGSTVSWGTYFAFYRQYKNWILTFNGYPQDSYKHLQSWQYLSAAFAAGWSTSILTNPIWVIKTRMISTDRGASNAYKSIWDGIKQIYKREGWKGYYRGLSPALLNVAQGAVQLSIYDTLKGYKLKNRERLDVIEYLYLSALSKIMATCVFYPLQVIRSRLQASSGDNRGLRLAEEIYRQEGIRSFYKGLVTNLCRVVPATCLTFVVYEEMKHLLGL